jgi:hypothetical protein
MIHNPPGPRVLVVATPAQWHWLIKKWLRLFGGKVGSPDVPWLLRANGTALSNQALVNTVDAIMYLDNRTAARDIPALKKIADKKKQLLLGMPLEGVNGRVMEPGDPSWHQLVELKPDHVPGVTMTQMDDGANPEELTFQVTAEDTTSVFLSMQAHRNWHATVDGKTAAAFAGGPDLVSTMVPKGKHTLVFRYARSVMEKRTFALSAVVWLFVLAGLLLPRAANAIRKLRTARNY